MKNINDLEIDLEELEKDKKKNFEERLKFIDWWVEYMKKNKNWSKGQNELIDSQIE